MLGFKGEEYDKEDTARDVKAVISLKKVDGQARTEASPLLG